MLQRKNARREVVKTGAEIHEFPRNVYNNKVAQICLNCTSAKCASGKCVRYARKLRQLREELGMYVPQSKSEPPKGKKLYEYNGKRLTIEEWSIETGINGGTIRTRLSRGVSFEDAISKPVKTTPVMCVEYEGQKKPLYTWCRMYGIDVSTCKSRLKNGWSIHDALTTPARKKSNSKARKLYEDE